MKRKGFALVEFMIVVACVGILIALIVPQVAKQRTLDKEASMYSCSDTAIVHPLKLARMKITGMEDAGWTYGDHPYKLKLEGQHYDCTWLYFEKMPDYKVGDYMYVALLAESLGTGEVIIGAKELVK